MDTKYYQKYIEKIINAKSVSIILKRQIKTDDGYGGDIIENTLLPTQQFYIYDKKYSREIITDAGKSYYSTIDSKMLCLGDADIKKDDTLVYQGNTYNVQSVESYFDICKQAELEVIK